MNKTVLLNISYHHISSPLLLFLFLIGVVSGYPHYFYRRKKVLSMFLFLLSVSLIGVIEYREASVECQYFKNERPEAKNTTFYIQLLAC